MITRRHAAFVLGALLLAAPLAPAYAQRVNLLDVNKASEADLTKLPNMNAATAKAMVAARPFKTVVDLNTFLLAHSLTQDQAKEFYGKAFVPINLNTGTREEIMLIPNAAARMPREFAEYRPWVSWAQFDKEIGKYVGQDETDRLKSYVFIPGL